MCLTGDKHRSIVWINSNILSAFFGSFNSLFKFWLFVQHFSGDYFDIFIQGSRCVILFIFFFVITLLFLFFLFFLFIFLSLFFFYIILLFFLFVILFVFFLIFFLFFFLFIFFRFFFYFCRFWLRSFLFFAFLIGIFFLC